ncbi:hypothetical protein [Streptomyces roseifaciens]|uniref:hypothetical protein n=1 Tax=Streptomyces roseifaciens TaxID=1488406 RepID=UPI000A3F859D|nr:hypothetical protein [Streptomyces roseifaciens]
MQGRTWPPSQRAGRRPGAGAHNAAQSAAQTDRHRRPAVRQRARLPRRRGRARATAARPTKGLPERRGPRRRGRPSARARRPRHNLVPDAHAVHEDHRLAAKILGLRQTAIHHGAFARRVPGILTARGLLDVQVDPHTLVINNTHVDNAIENGQFLYSVTYFLTSTTVPTIRS